MVEWPVSPDTMPFLREHVVRGIPTLPGSFIIVMAADAAHQLLPDLKIVQFERTRFLRFVRAHEGRLTKVRAISNVTGRDKDETVVRVRIVLDFVHKSGRVLEKDLLHTEIYVRMAPTVRESTEVFNFSANGTPAVRLEDPYVMESSPVRLNGGFKAIGKILVDDKTRRADYKLRGDASYGSNFDYLIPNIIMVDAFWRFGTVRVNENGNLAVYVPERCDAMKVFFDYTDFSTGVLRGPVTFRGSNPRPEGDQLHVGPIEAYDASGRVLLRVEGGVCRNFGDIKVN